MRFVDALGLLFLVVLLTACADDIRCPTGTFEDDGVCRCPLEGLSSATYCKTLDGTGPSVDPLSGARDGGAPDSSLAPPVTIEPHGPGGGREAGGTEGAPDAAVAPGPAVMPLPPGPERSPTTSETAGHGTPGTTPEPSPVSPAAGPSPPPAVQMPGPPAPPSMQSCSSATCPAGSCDAAGQCVRREEQPGPPQPPVTNGCEGGTCEPAPCGDLFIQPGEECEVGVGGWVKETCAECKRLVYRPCRATDDCSDGARCVYGMCAPPTCGSGGSFGRCRYDPCPVIPGFRWEVRADFCLVPCPDGRCPSGLTCDVARGFCGSPM